MKKIYLLGSLILFSTTVLAGTISIGATATKTNNLYKGGNQNVKYFPYVNMEYGNVYINGNKIGIKVFETQKIAFSTYIDLFDGYNIKGKDMNSGYKSINSRKTQIAIGGELDIDLSNLDRGLKLSTHFQGGERGQNGGIELSKFFSLVDGKFIIIPQINVQYYSKDYADYYFGIDKNEVAAKIRTTYSPKSSYSFGAGLYSEYYFTKYFSISGFLGIDRFSDEVNNSPITKNKVSTYMGLGFKYSFKY